MKPSQDLPIDSQQEDLSLCAEILAGNTESFSVLAEKYRKRIFSLGYGFFRNPDDAEDFLQDVLVKVYVSLASFRGEARFSTWLMRVAHNTAINSKKRKREYTSLAEDFDVMDTDYTPEEQCLQGVSREAIRDAVAELPERYRVCIDLFFFYDMPYADISVVTALPVNTIKSHVFRAKKILRERLDEGV